MAINNYFRCNENKISLMLLGDKYLRDGINTGPNLTVSP